MALTSTNLLFRPRFGLKTLTRMLAVARERKALAALDTARLEDLGLTPEEARWEAEKPFWDIPTYWAR